MCLVIFELGPNQKLEETQAGSLKCLGQPAQILLDNAVRVVHPADINKRGVQQVTHPVMPSCSDHHHHRAQNRELISTTG